MKSKSKISKSKVSESKVSELKVNKSKVSKSEKGKSKSGLDYSKQKQIAELLILSSKKENRKSYEVIRKLKNGDIVKYGINKGGYRFYIRMVRVKSTTELKNLFIEAKSKKRKNNTASIRVTGYTGKAYIKEGKIKIINGERKGVKFYKIAKKQAEVRKGKRYIRLTSYRTMIRNLLTDIYKYNIDLEDTENIGYLEEPEE